MVKLNNIKLHSTLLALRLWGRPLNTFAFGPHFDEVVDALPDETVVVRLEDRVEVVGLCGLQYAFIDDIFFLFIDVFEIFGLILYFE